MTRSDKLDYMIQYLKAGQPLPEKEEEKLRLFRSLVNVRPPAPVSDAFLRVQDDFLREEIERKGITDVETLRPVRENLCLWQGDITTLRADAVVNAANSQLLGCFFPCHSCIDNVIHTYAGVQLRLACADIMRKQGHPEKTGGAKITEAFNLPSRYVLHTVGPIVSGTLTRENCEKLASCYRSCLELAVKAGLRSIAFCCISTGEFHFPNERAAEIAVHTVLEYLAAGSHKIKVVFNVFQDKDYAIYRRLLGDEKPSCTRQCL